MPSESPLEVTRKQLLSVHKCILMDTAKKKKKCTYCFNNAMGFIQGNARRLRGLQCAVSSGTCNCFPQLAQTLPQVPFAPQNQSLPPASATSSTVKESHYRIGGSCINSQHVSGGELSWASHHQRSGLLLMSCLNKCQQ